MLCDDDFIQALNATHRNKDKPTDVLSFPQGDPLVLGDIVISLDTANRQAEAVGWSLRNEVILLAIHGTLHLIGYDDETIEGAVQMRDKSAEILKRADIDLPHGQTHPYFVEYI